MEKELENLGLSEKEAKIYLALLGLGQAPVGIIARQASVKRPNTYVVLENLIKAGLVLEVADPKEKMFKAEAPEKLQKLTKKMRRQTIAAELQLEAILPELKLIQKHLVEAPKVRFYQGISGVKNIIEEVSESKNSWYYLGSGQEITKMADQIQLDEFLEETKKIREKVGRPIAYYITDRGIKNISRFKNYEPGNRQMKFFPEVIKPRSALIIYDNKLAIINISEAPFGAIIESQEVVNLLQIMFKFIWKSLPEVKF